MKKDSALFLMLTIIFTLVGCGQEMQSSAVNPTETPKPSIDDTEQIETDTTDIDKGEEILPAEIDYEFITMDRTKPILPSVKAACLSAFLNNEETRGLTLLFVRLSDDEQHLYIEAGNSEQEKNCYFRYDIKLGTISPIEPQTEAPLVLWTNCYENDTTNGKAIAARILDEYDNFTLNQSLYNTMLTLIPVQLTKEYIDATTTPTICVFPFKDYYCFRVDYIEGDISHTYQLFCDYQDNVIEKQGYSFSLADMSIDYYGDLEEYMEPNLLTVWADDIIRVTGQVNVSSEGTYYIEIPEKNVFLVEYREFFEKCNRLNVHETLSEYVGTTITAEGYLNNFRGGGTLYLEELQIVS